jgi:hypothetical protein
VPHPSFKVGYGGFNGLLEPLVEVATPELDVEHVHSFDIDFPVKKYFRRVLDYE